MRSIGMSCGSSSLKTPHSRIRRAISCEYWPPKSRTRTSSDAVAGADLETSTSSGSDPGTVRSGTRTRDGWSEAAEAASVIRDSDSDFDRSPAIRAHAHGLLALELLALGHQRWGDHHLGPVELRDVGVAGGRHGGPQGSYQVEGAVVLLGGSHEDLL